MEEYVTCLDTYNVKRGQVRALLFNVRHRGFVTRVVGLSYGVRTRLTYTCRWGEFRYFVLFGGCGRYGGTTTNAKGTERSIHNYHTVASFLRQLYNGVTGDHHTTLVSTRLNFFWPLDRPRPFRTSALGTFFRFQALQRGSELDHQLYQGALDLSGRPLGPYGTPRLCQTGNRPYQLPVLFRALQTW